MKEKLLAYLQERFGMEPSLFDDYEFYGASRGRIYLGPKSIISDPEPISVGILAARTGNAIKPSTNLLQLFGSHATKGFIELGKEDALKFANGEDIEPPNDCTEGYLLLRYKGRPLGCGFLKDGVIANQVPKAKRLQLKFL